MDRESTVSVMGAGDAKAPRPPDTKEFRRKNGHPCRDATAANVPERRGESNRAAECVNPLERPQRAIPAGDPGETRARQARQNHVFSCRGHYAGGFPSWLL